MANIKEKAISIIKFIPKLIMPATMLYLATHVYGEIKEDAAIKDRNRETCLYIGTVSKASCATICRVELDNEERVNMNLSVLKGDRIEHCTNSETKYKYKDYYKIQE